MSILGQENGKLSLKIIINFQQAKNGNETGSNFKPKFSFTFDGAVKMPWTQVLL